MNYLAHFHLAGDDEGMIVGALLGDFIKGPLNSSAISAMNLSPEILHGIQLHRSIDNYVDNLTGLTQLGKLLPASFWRFKHIFLDLFFDYILCRYWQCFDYRPLEEYSRNIVSILNRYRGLMPKPAQQLLSRLDDHQLLYKYGQRSIQNAIIKRTGERLHQDALFASAIDSIWQLEAQWTSSCLAIYPQIQSFAHKKRNDLSCHDSFYLGIIDK